MRAVLVLVLVCIFAGVLGIPLQRSESIIPKYTFKNDEAVAEREVVQSLRTVATWGEFGFFQEIRSLWNAKLQPILFLNASDPDAFSTVKNTEGIMLAIIVGEPKPLLGSRAVSLDPNSEEVQILRPYILFMNRIAEWTRFVVETKIPHLQFSSFQSDEYKSSMLGMVYDMEKGTVFINDLILKELQKVPSHKIVRSYEKLLSQLQTLTETLKNSHTPSEFISKIELDMFAIMQESLVVCAVCVFSLSLLIPLAANYVLIQTALVACSALNLSENVCTALWGSAVAIVFMSLPVMAYGIFMICNVPACIGKL